MGMVRGFRDGSLIGRAPLGRAVAGVAVATALSLGSAIGYPAPAEAAAGFLPHRALYGLSLGESRSGSSSFTHAVGKLEFTWSDVCDGWAVTQRTHINLTGLDGREVRFGWTLSSWESKDGLSYRFFIRRLQGEEQTEELRGHAMLSGPEGAARQCTISRTKRP